MRPHALAADQKATISTGRPAAVSRESVTTGGGGWMLLAGPRAGWQVRPPTSAGDFRLARTDPTEIVQDASTITLTVNWPERVAAVAAPDPKSSAMATDVDSIARIMASVVPRNTAEIYSPWANSLLQA